MNDIVLRSFADELEKIAQIARRVFEIGRSALPTAAVRAGGKKAVSAGLTSAEHLSRRISRVDKLPALRMAREEKVKAQLLKQIESGAFDPKKHSIPKFMQSRGKNVAERARTSVPEAKTVVKPGAKTSPTAETVLHGGRVPPKPTAAAPAPKPTPNPIQHAPPPAAAAPQTGKMTPGMRRILGATGLGGAGAGGYGVNAAVD